MATFSLVNSSAPYYTIIVYFQDQEFQQTIVSDKTGSALEAQFAAYADQYEQDWLAMQGAD